MKAKSIFLSLILGLGLTFVFIVLVKTTAGAAPDQPNKILCVRTSGGGCYTTIQAAVNDADSGDTIRVAEGEYHERVTMAKSLILQGGWNTTFTGWNWTAFRTTIDADGLGSVIYIDGTSTPVTTTIEGFYITDGDASSFLGWGGGILARGSWGNPGLISIRNNYISENIACRLDACQGYGGGIMIYSNHSIIENNAILNNTARSDGRGSGQGGGIAIWGFPTDATLYGNVIEYNTAVISTTGEYSTGDGGGLWSGTSGEVVATHNWIRENVAAEKGQGFGGGVYSAGNLYDNEIISNTASVDGPGYGGGVYAYYTPDFHDNLVKGNVASQNGSGSGGGIYALYLRDARGNTIWNNRATNGGGVYFEEYPGEQKFYNNLVARNTADGLNTSLPEGGGGIFSEADWVEITSNQILTNTALAGGGVLVTSGDKFLLQSNLIRGNIAAAGGGIFLQDMSGQILRNRIGANSAIWWGGGLFLTGSSSPQLDSNLVMYNTALGNSGLAAGGVMVAVDASTHITMTNTLVAYNIIPTSPAGLPASGVHCVSGSCSLIHCTIADNKKGTDPGEGVRIGARGGTNRVWNSIIVGHSMGLVIESSAPHSLDYNDYYDNATNLEGSASPGVHSLYVAPLFVNRWAGDYHLSQGSPLINAGDNNLSFPHDIEGDPRMQGPDIGADEYIHGHLFLPLLMKNYTPCPGC
jgi:hypothetical protein